MWRDLQKNEFLRYLECKTYQGHKEFQTRECGLYFYRKKRFHGASPDEIAKCPCHEEKHLIKMKCSYSKKDVMQLEDASSDTSVFLDLDKSLKRSHQYF